jgi:hypothetical protein
MSNGLSKHTAAEGLKQLEQAIGGREELRAALTMTRHDPAMDRLLDLLLDPARYADTLAHLCKDAGVKPIEVLDLFRQGSFATAHAIATHRLAEGLPKVVEATLSRAVDRKRECPACGAQPGKVEECPKCFGRGEIVQEADLERQKLIFESTNLLKKGGGINITQQTQVVNNVPRIMDRFVRETDSAAYDVKVDRDVVDGEVR